MPKRDNSDVLSGRPSSTPSRGGVTKTQTSDSEKPRHARCIETSDVVAFDKERFHNAVAFDNRSSTAIRPPRKIIQGLMASFLSTMCFVSVGSPICLSCCLALWVTGIWNFAIGSLYIVIR